MKHPIFYLPFQPISLVCSVLLLLLSACNNQAATDTLLRQPPFNKLTDSIKADPTNAELYYRRGVLLFQNDQPVYAEQDAKQAWTLTPKEMYGVSVSNFIAKRNGDSAVQFLQMAIKVLPQSIALKMNLARLYQERKELDKALAMCREISTHYPNQLDALLLQAQILKEQNQNAEALTTLEKAYSYAPFDAELAYNLAFEYAQAKNPKALSLADSLLKKDSSKTHAEPYYCKGLFYENTGNFTQAIQYLDEAVQHDFYFLDAYMEKGSIFYNQKKYYPALKTFNLALRVSPTFADAYYWSGKCNEAMNKKEEAKLNYQRAYSLDKTLTEAKEAAGRL